jgi:hypothetical protein
MKYLAFIALLALSFTAEAQTRVTNCNAATPWNAVCLDWTQDGRYTDGSTIPATDVLTYMVQRRLGLTGPWTTIVATQPERRYYDTGLAAGTYYYRVFAMGVRGSSDSSNVSNYGASSGTPTAPVLTIAVVIGISHAPVYRMTQTGERDKRYADACGYIEVGKECQGKALARFRDTTLYRVAAADVKPWQVSCGTSIAAPCA